MAGEPRVHRHTERNAELVYKDKASGRWVRLSLGTRDDDGCIQEALETARSQWTLGLPIVLPGAKAPPGPGMLIDEFQELYTAYLLELRSTTRDAQLSRLRIAIRIVKPKTLGDLATHEAMMQVRAALLAKTPSKASARSRMTSILGILKWAKDRGMLPSIPSVPPIKTSKINVAKGRPLTPDEVVRFLENLQSITKDRFPSWDFLARGLMASTMRIEEALRLHWEDPDWIVPDLKARTLRIPAHLQKNDTEDEVPMSPPLVVLLSDVPIDQRDGFVFDPLPQRPGRWIREPRTVGRTYSKAGEAAGIVVGKRMKRDKAGRSLGMVPKFASAHDLRRTGLQVLSDADVPPRLIQRVARHRSYETTERYYTKRQAEKDAAKLWDIVMKHTQKGTHNES